MGKDPCPQIIKVNFKQTNNHCPYHVNEDGTFAECLTHSETGSDRRLSFVIGFMHSSGSKSFTGAGTQARRKEASYSVSQYCPELGRQ